MALPPTTRSITNLKCPCTVCIVAKLSESEYGEFRKARSNPIGKPSESTDSPPAKTLALCTRCFGELGRGKAHDCQKCSQGVNLSNLVKKATDKSKATVASEALHDIAQNEGVSTRGGIVALPSGNKKLSVTIGTPKVAPKAANFTHEDLMRLQGSQNLSDRCIM